MKKKNTCEKEKNKSMHTLTLALFRNTETKKLANKLDLIPNAVMIKLSTIFFPPYTIG